MITSINEFKSNLAKHALKELTLIGMFNGDKYNELISKNILDLCELFGTQGHSGFSAQYVIDIFNKLAKYKTLSDITSNPDEWQDVSHYSDDKPGTIFQNKRDSSYFSYDNLKTWSSVDEKYLIEKISNIINEALNKQNNNSEIFDYKSTIKDLWRPIIKQAQKFQNINFDLENNYSLDDKRILTINKNLRKDQPVKCKYNIELYEAGGDWECTVLYFKIELENQYSLISNKYKSHPEYVWDLENKIDSKKFVLIPDILNGNINLIKSNNGYTAKKNDYTSEKTDTDINKRLAWKWIENLLIDATNKRWEMLD